MLHTHMGFPGGSDGKESACNARDLGSIPGLGRLPRGGHGNPLQYSYLENSHRQKNLAGCSPWGSKESDMTEWLSLSLYNYLFRKNMDFDLDGIQIWNILAIFSSGPINQTDQFASSSTSGSQSNSSLLLSYCISYLTSLWSHNKPSYTQIVTIYFIISAP